jgi:DNA-binding transcriptional LysR family regulator
MMDRLEEWRMFVAVAGRSSFVEAARALGRSPQTVTRAVAALEARLGTRLLHRTTRSVSLTGEGERQIERGRRALAELDLLESGVDSAASLAGKLSVTAPMLFCCCWIGWCRWPRKESTSPFASGTCPTRRSRL